MNFEQNKIDAQTKTKLDSFVSKIKLWDGKDAHQLRDWLEEINLTCNDLDVHSGDWISPGDLPFQDRIPSELEEDIAPPPGNWSESWYNVCTVDERGLCVVMASSGTWEVWDKEELLALRSANTYGDWNQVRELANRQWDKDGQSRESIIRWGIRDPTVLQHAALQDLDPTVRLAAVENKALTDQETLSQVAQLDSDEQVQIAAIVKLEDIGVLQSIYQSETISDDIMFTTRRRLRELGVDTRGL